jgi:hypothetical protein
MHFEKFSAGRQRGRDHPEYALIAECSQALPVFYCGPSLIETDSDVHRSAARVFRVVARGYVGNRLSLPVIYTRIPQ